MSEILIHLKFETYLAEWVNHTFGNPVVLIKDNPEMRVLNEMLVKKPKHAPEAMRRKQTLLFLFLISVERILPSITTILAVAMC